MNKEIKTISPFKNFCVTIGNLPTSYLESMSYYEMLCWFCKYLENTINPAINNNAEALKELQEYVANYFDELNVQTEINNKLDEMVEDGTMAEIINQEIFTDLNNRIDDLENEINQQRFSTCEEVGHRGAPEDTIENTITSFEYAFNKGFKYFECDLQTTSDNFMVLFHNATVDSTTNGSGTVNNLTYSYLRGLTYTAGGNISSYPNSQINDIDELIDFLKRTDIKCFLEIKETWSNTNLTTLYGKLKNNGLLNKIIFTSFYNTYLEHLRTLDKNIKASYLIGDITNSLIEYCSNNNFIIAPSLTNLTKGNVDLAHSNNIEVYTWTINSINDYQNALYMNVDYICTNSRLYCYPSTDNKMSNYNYIYPIFSKYDLYSLNKKENVVPYATGSGYPSGIFPSLSRATTLQKIYVNSGDTLNFIIDSTKYNIALPSYNKDNQLVTDSGWINDSSYTVTGETSKWCYAYFKKVDNTNFKDYELDEIGKCANDITITRA